MMKMIVAILHNTDGESTLEALTQADFRVYTRGRHRWLSPPWQRHIVDWRGRETSFRCNANFAGTQRTGHRSGAEARHGLCIERRSVRTDLNSVIYRTRNSTIATALRAY